MTPAVLVLIIIASVLFATRFEDGRRPEYVGIPRGRDFIFALAISSCLTALGSVIFLLSGRAAFPFDDSYITLSAARNLLLKGSLFLDPDHPLAGVTSPLHVAVVAALGVLTGIENASRAVGIAAHLMIAIAAFFLGRYYGRTRLAGIVSCVLVSLSGSFGYHQLNGMETTLFAALVAWTWCLGLKDHPSFARLAALGAFLAAAVLTRPEGWFLVAAVYADLGLRFVREREKKNLVRLVFSAILMLALISPYLAANLHYTGHFLPTTAGAKAAFFKVANRGMAPGIVSTLLGIFKLCIRLPLLIPLFVLGLWDHLNQKPVRPAIFIFVLIFYASYLFRFGAGLNMYWLRYQMPVLLVYIVFASAGFSGLLDRLASKARSLAPRRVAAGLCFFLVLSMSAYEVSRMLKHYQDDVDSSTTVIIPAARWVRDNTRPEALIAAHDIGGLYYFSARKILDLVGLTDADMAALHSKDVSRRLLWEHLARRRPDYLVVFPAWDRDFFHFHEYDAAGVMSPVWKSEGMEKPAAPEEVYRYEVYRCDWEKMKTAP